MQDYSKNEELSKQNI